MVRILSKGDRLQEVPLAVAAESRRVNRAPILKSQYHSPAWMPLQPSLAHARGLSAGFQVLPIAGA